MANGRDCGLPKGDTTIVCRDLLVRKYLQAGGPKPLTDPFQQKSVLEHATGERYGTDAAILSER